MYIIIHDISSISYQLSAGTNYRHRTLGNYSTDLYGECVTESLLHMASDDNGQPVSIQVAAVPWRNMSTP